MPAIVAGENTQHVRQEWVAARRRGAVRARREPPRPARTSRATTSISGSTTAPSSSRSWSRAAAGASCGTTPRSRASAICASWSRSRPTASTTPAASAAASPARITRARTSRSWSASASIASSTSRCPARRRNPTRSSTPVCREGRTPACAGRARSSPSVSRRLHVPDLLERRHQAVDRRQAGHRPLAPGLAAVEGRRQGAAGGQAPPQAAARVEQGPGHGDGAAAVEAALAEPASAPTSLWSEVGDGIDYYFVYGPELDQVVAGYRRVTGPAPMMPRWAFGLWQSRAALRDGEGEPRRRRRLPQARHPVRQHRAGLVLLEGRQWGSHEFDPVRFPDPDRWIKAIHDKHARVMISVWPKFYPGTKNFEAMRTQGFLFQRNLAEGLRDWVGKEGGYPYTFYDAFNPAAGEAVLVADEPRAVSQQGRRLVAGRDRAGPAADAHARRAAELHAPDRARHRARACSTPTRSTTARPSTKGSARRRRTSASSS